MPADKNGFYCLKNYDINGEGVATTDYTQGAAGSSAIEFCKSVCQANSQCQFVVTQLGKCYVKNSMGQGQYGSTGANAKIDAVCINGPANWQGLASRLSAQPAMNASPMMAALTSTKKATKTSSCELAVAHVPRSLLLGLLGALLLSMLT